MWSEIALACLAVLLAVYLYGLRPLNRWRYRDFPGPKPAWLVGSAATVLGADQIYSYLRWAKQFGPRPYALALASETMVVLPDPEDARNALLHAPARPDMNSRSVIPRKRKENNPADSLLWARGEKWRSLRAAWQPVFFSGSLKGYMEIMDDAAKLLVEEMMGSPTGNEKYYDVQPMVQSMTMSVIGQSAFGVELHTQKADKAWQSEEDRKRSSELLRAARAALAPSGSSRWVVLTRLFPFLVPIIKPIAKRFPDKPMLTFLYGRDTIREVVDRLLDDHQAALDAQKKHQDSAMSVTSLVDNGSKPSSNGTDSTSALANGTNHANLSANQEHQPASINGVTPQQVPSAVKSGVLNSNGLGEEAANGRSSKNGPVPEIRKGVKPGSFIDLLVRGSMRETGQQFTRNEKAQQVLLMLMAGYETSANTLVFTIYLLARSCHSHIQEKVIQEVDALGSDYVPKYDDLESKMPYLDAVVKESLRLFPPGHLLLRDTTEPLELKDRVLPMGQMVAISSYALHHDQRVWGETVEEFLPERWLAKDAESLKRTRQGFFAFGDGARVCPGSRFALLEIKIALIRIFQSATLHLAPGQEPLKLRSTITLGPGKGVWIRTEPR